MSYFSTIIITKEGKWFVAKSVDFGVVSQGKTLEEAQKNLKEAIELFLEDQPNLLNTFKKRTQAAPLITSLELDYV